MILTGKWFEMRSMEFEIDFEAAIVSVGRDHVRTRFRADGSETTATVGWGDRDHIAASWVAGYGGDQARMLVEHEIVHTFLAEAQGAPHSRSLWAAAHGNGEPTPPDTWPQHIKDEEHLAVSFQRYVNTGDRDRYGALDAAFGDRLPALAERFVRLARPWLFPGKD